MPEDRDLKKILDDLKKQLKSDPKTPYDQTDLFQELKDKIEEENRKSGEKTEAALKEETEVLKEGNEHNKAMNIAQIAKEVYTFRREREADKATHKAFDEIIKNQKSADVNTKKQIKHNRGAKEAREIMLEQNKLQLQNDNATAAQLEEIQNTNQNILNILQQTVEGPEGAQKGDLKKGSDGHVYEYEGAQWVDQKTGKMATRQMAQELNTNPTTTSAPKATTGPQVVKVEVANTEELSQATKDVETEERRASQPASQPESRRGQRAQPTAETTRPLSPEEIAELANRTTRGGEALNERSKRSGFGMSDEAYARQRQRDEASMERIAKRKDIQNKSAEVSTNKDALNLDKIAQDELDTGAQRLGMDETLRVRGRHGKAVNYSRYETGYGGKDKDPSEQTAKFGGRDDDGKWLGLQDTDPIRELAEDINISQGVVGTTRNRTQNRISQSSATMFKAIGESGSAVQKALEENPQAREDFDKLTKLMQKVQTGKGDDKTVAELQTQIERLKMTGGEDLAKNLNLDQVQKDAKGGFFKNLKDKVKTDFLGINMGTDIFSKKGLGEIFSADRIFGTAGTGKAANISALQGTNQFVENATRELEQESQDEAQRRYESNTYLVDEQKPETGTSHLEEWREKWIPEENREATATAAAPQQAAQMEEEVPDEAAGSKPEKRKSKREKMVSERTGVSKDQDKLATEETLKKILERLENMSSIGGPGGGGDDGGLGLDDAAMAAGGASVAGGGGLFAGLKAKAKSGLGKVKSVGSKAGGLLKGAASGAGKVLGGAGRALGAAARFAGPVGLAITAGASLYGGFKGFTADKDASFGRKMMNAGSGALNTLSFGLLGTDPEDMAAEGQQRRTLESAEESGLYDKDLLGNSEIDRTKIYDATPEQLQAILDDDDLNESDRKVVEDALTQKTTSPERQAEIRKRENDEFAFGTAVPVETRSEGAVMYDEEFLNQGPPPIDATREGYRSEGNLPKGVGTATPVKKGMVIPSNTDGANVVGAEAKASGGMVIPGTDPLITATTPEVDAALVPDLGPGEEKATGLFGREHRGGLLGKLFGGEGVGDAITTGLAAVVPGGMIAKSMFEGGKGEGLISKAGEFLGLGSAEKAVTPTADAVTNMSRLGKEADQMASAPIVVNNTNNQSAPAEKAGQDNMLAVMTEPTVRLRSTSSLVRAQDRRFI